MDIMDVTLRESVYYGSGIDYFKALEYLRHMVQYISENDVQYVEIGYVNNDEIDGLNYSDEYIEKAAEICKSKFKLVAMMHPGKADISAWNENTIKKLSMVRIVCNGNKIPENIKEYIEYLHNCNVEVSVNIAYIMNKTEHELVTMYTKCQEYGADYIYFADSSGSATFKEIEYYCDLLKKMRKYNKIGFHLHDHLNMAFANALEAYFDGIDIIDSSVTGAGKGGGNLKTELIIPYLHMYEEQDITSEILINLYKYIEFFGKLINNSIMVHEQIYIDSIVGLFKMTLKQQIELNNLAGSDISKYIEMATEAFKKSKGAI